MFCRHLKWSLLWVVLWVELLSKPFRERQLDGRHRWCHSSPVCLFRWLPTTATCEGGVPYPDRMRCPYMPHPTQKWDEPQLIMHIHSHLAGRQHTPRRAMLRLHWHEDSQPETVGVCGVTLDSCGRTSLTNLQFCWLQGGIALLVEDQVSCGWTSL